MNFTQIEDWIKLSYETRTCYLKLDTPCLCRGGTSTQHKGVLAQFLGTTIPSGKIVLCHACGNGKCSNPLHLYWGTHHDNLVKDQKRLGVFKDIWQRVVEKYGYEEACRRQKKSAELMAKAGRGNKGKPKSIEHRKKLSEAAWKKGS